MNIYDLSPTSRDIKKIQSILSDINNIFFHIEYAEKINPNLIDNEKKRSIEYKLMRVVSYVEEVDCICNSGNRSIISSHLFENRWFPPRNLKTINTAIIEKVLAIRNNLNLPPVYQEEIEVFLTYH